MKVVLLSELKGKGGEGDIVDVAQGYAENYLFPKKLAVAATKGNLKQLEERRSNIEKREAARIEQAGALKAALEGKQVIVDAKVGDEGILFGSVTAAMIAEAIQKQLDVEIDRKRVELGKPIKVAGVHEVVIGLYRDIRASVEVLIGITAEEADEQAKAQLAKDAAEGPATDGADAEEAEQPSEAEPTASSE
ncbi:LSU ribosomal protein L9P [Coriobacterium glomerans PW2]|uniref:Large ribosomal subunit protein bL9 n=1 Tax=Coriobacterium glomerans (strain ATCC 49209 / DSM 20642 / JCM 10262 / PW2) TaxID=700015 RepID=F2N9C5_CORGP|nr:50S ribosomal protein L9 [Coriobacterium glomerans]AEB07873.1 LSU ribosomal protein L9P [Coriobacterium glomerans PW2]